MLCTTSKTSQHDSLSCCDHIHITVWICSTCIGRTILLQGQGFSQKVPLKYGWTLEDLFVSLIANQVTTSRFYSSDQWWTRWTWWMLYLGQLKRCSKVEMQLSTWQLLHHSWTALLQNQLFPRTHHTMQCPSQHCPQKQCKTKQVGRPKCTVYHAKSRRVYDCHQMTFLETSSAAWIYFTDMPMLCFSRFQLWIHWASPCEPVQLLRQLVIDRR